MLVMNTWDFVRGTVARLFRRDHLRGHADVQGTH